MTILNPIHRAVSELVNSDTSDEHWAIFVESPEYPDGSLDFIWRSEMRDSKNMLEWIEAPRTCQLDAMP